MAADKILIVIPDSKEIMGDENAAPFSAFDVEETESVTVLKYLLNAKRVKSQVNIRDTYPNADGFLEIVNKEQEPIGRLTIQVKKVVR